MSNIELMTDSNRLSVPFRCWKAALSDAKENGWTPEGTILHGDDQWCGDYLSQHSQYFDDGHDLGATLLKVAPEFYRPLAEFLMKESRIWVV